MINIKRSYCYLFCRYQEDKYYYKQLNTYKFINLIRIDQFFNNYQPPYKQAESSRMITEIQPIIQNFLKKKSTGPNCFIGELYQTLKEEP